MRKMKRILGFLLAFAMMFGCFFNTSIAFAEESETELMPTSEGSNQYQLYFENDRFLFPKNVGESKSIEMEGLELHNNTEGDEDWPLQVTTGSSWASEGKFLNCLNSNDSVHLYYDAPAGIYSAVVTYRSGSPANSLVWSEAEDKIIEGNVIAGANDSAGATHTATFTFEVVQSGEGVLIFTGGAGKAPQLDKIEITATTLYALELDLGEYVTISGKLESVEDATYVDTEEMFGGYERVDGNVAIQSGRYLISNGVNYVSNDDTSTWGGNSGLKMSSITSLSAEADQKFLWKITKKDGNQYIIQDINNQYMTYGQSTGNNCNTSVDDGNEESRQLFSISSGGNNQYTITNTNGGKTHYLNNYGDGNSHAGGWHQDGGGSKWYLYQASYSVKITGLAYGTTTVVVDGTEYEIKVVEKEVDKTQLRSLYEQHSADVSNKVYTIATREVLESALEEALAVLENDAAANADVQRAMDALENAHSGLILKSEAKITLNESNVSAGSFQDNHQATQTPVKAVDGNLDTKWHTKWNYDAGANGERWFQINLESNYIIYGLKYHPPGSTETGCIKNYNILAGDTENVAEFTTIIEDGLFSETDGWNTVTFEGTPISAKCIRLEVNSIHPQSTAPNNEQREYFAAANEIELLGVPAANYAEVDAAIAEAEALDRDLYTGASLAVVDAAVANVNRLKDSEAQAEVDAMESAIQEAIDRLEEKSELVIPVSEMIATDGDHQEGNDKEGGAAFAIDDREDTMWHTNWNGSSTHTNHWLQIELRNTHKVYKFRYLPRKAGSVNGVITEYIIQVSNDGQTWTNVVEGTWDNTRVWKDAEFTTPVATKFVRLQTVNALTDKSVKFASAAEIELVGYKVADYSAVDAAIAKVESLYSEIYTEESYKAVEDAVNAVNRNKDSDEQPEVDAMASAINTAIAELTLKPEAMISDIKQATACGSANNNNDGGPAYALDNDRNTLWHTPYGGNGNSTCTHEPVSDHWFMFELNSRHKVYSLYYLPRENGNNAITQYQIYVSDNGSDWTEVAIEGNDNIGTNNIWAANNSLKTATFKTPTWANYVKLQVRATGANHAVASKIYLAGFEGADYSALDAALEEAKNLDADWYTTETWADLEAVVGKAEAFDRNKTIEAQSDVDSMTVELTDAIVALQLKLQFYGASLSLEDNISVNFKVNRTDATNDEYSDPYVKVVFNEDEYEIKEYTKDSLLGDRYVFTFANIAPQCMNDIITATLYAKRDGEYVEIETRTYSIAEYCYTTLEKNRDDESKGELKTLIVDLLNYGSAAQVYTNYKTGTLVNAGLNAEDMVWAKDLASKDITELTSVTKVNQATVANPIVNWYSVSLRLNNAVNIRYKIQVTDPTNLAEMTMKVETENGDSVVIDSDEFVKAEEDYYYVYFEELNAGQMSVPFDATVYVGETPVSNTLRYSVESYVVAKQKDAEARAELKDLLKEMIKYGYSANRYAN